MKSLKYLSLLALSALLGLWSCSVDTLSTSPAHETNGRKVTLTLSGVSTAKTRTASMGGFDREKAIDGNKLYAVVFDQQGKFSKTYPITNYESSGNTCSFTLDDAGVYYGYIVANTSKGTALTGLTSGASTEDDFYNIIEDTDPGTDLAASTNFLMVSKRMLLDVDGDADTSLGTVTLTRCVARIDIDATAITGLAITKVEVQNRYKKTLLVRGNSPADGTLSAATPTDTKTYTRGTGSGEVDALSDGTGLVSDQEWQGVVYCYENINTNTVVKVTHTLNGVASTTTLDFSTINGGQAIKRNNIYTIKLANEALTPTLQNITATINVIDWDTSTNLSYTDLTDHAKPDFEITSGHDAQGFTSGTLNPQKVIAKATDNPTEITLQVTSQGKVASEVSFVDKNGAAYDFLGVGVGGSIEQVGATALIDGKIVQNYKITIPQTIVSGMTVYEYLTFKVHNVFDDTSTASRTFKVTGLDIRRNALWWMSEYNLSLSNDNETFYFDNTESTSQGSLFVYQSNDGIANHGVMGTKFAKSSTTYDGWQIPTSNDRKVGTDVNWHLPTKKEWLSVMPNSSNMFVTTNTPYTPNTVVTEDECVFGYNAYTRGGFQPKSYWSTYTNGDYRRYAIRFIGTEFCSVWRFENVNSPLNVARAVIKAKLIDKIDEDETDKLAAMMGQITNESYWTSMDENLGGISRTLYQVGVDNGGGYHQSAAGSFLNGERAHYWGATERSLTECWAQIFYYRSNHTVNLNTSSFGCRLFRDE